LSMRFASMMVMSGLLRSTELGIEDCVTQSFECRSQLVEESH